MSQIEGYYYLHQNGSLIYKPALDDGQISDFVESTFVKAFWPVVSNDRMALWDLLVESFALGADPARVWQLAEEWGADDADALQYAKRLPLLLSKDGDQFCATRTDFQDLAKSTAGVGATALEAMAQLATKLGLRPRKVWGTHFKDLVL